MVHDGEPVSSPALARDVRVISLVGSAHFVSHFFQLALPPLFPLMRDEFQVSWTALGLLVSLFYGASGIGQVIGGFVVDRLGARPVLFSGMGLLSGAIALTGLAPTYWALLPIALLAGLGNAVFHPADYSMINALVSPGRVGRAYSVHGIGGTLGYASGPAVMVAAATVWGWRAAAIAAGLAGLAVTALLASVAPASREAEVSHRARPASFASDVRMLLTAPIIGAFVYFLLYATAQVGFQTFSVAALVAIHAVPISAVAGALTGYLLGGAAGIVAGGAFADRASRPDLLVSLGLGAAALLILLASHLASLVLVTVVTTAAGFCSGLIAPSRDLLVRSVTPPGASGKVFGFAYAGLDAGSTMTPLIFGWLLDHGEPRAVFGVVAGLLLLTMLAVVPMRRRRVPTAARI